VEITGHNPSIKIKLAKQDRDRKPILVSIPLPLAVEKAVWILKNNITRELMQIFQFLK